MSIEILIGLLIIGFSVYKSYKEEKKKAAARARQQAEAVEEEEFSEEFPGQPIFTDEKEMEILRKKMAKSSVNLEESENISKNARFSSNKTKAANRRINNEKSQLENIDNEEFEGVELTFEEDEIRRGIIYSEILKRPDY